MVEVSVGSGIQYEDVPLRGFTFTSDLAPAVDSLPTALNWASSVSLLRSRRLRCTCRRRGWVCWAPVLWPDCSSAAC
jgi:hypothetical protein